MIYFTSDSHAFHKNLTKGVSKWTDKSSCRDFETPEEMTATLIKNINDTVGEDDILYHLGDWSFHSTSNIKEFRESLKCKTIHLILGNHDTELQKEQHLHKLFASISHYKEINIHNQLIVLSHFPFASWNKVGKGSWMLHGHCHGRLEKQISLSLLRKLLDDGQMDVIDILASKLDVEGIHLGGRRLDVGIDNHPEFRPFSFDEIQNYMKAIK